MNSSIDIDTLLQFVYRSLDSYSTEELEELVRKLEYAVAFPEEIKSRDESWTKVADVGLGMLKDELKKR